MKQSKVRVQSNQRSQVKGRCPFWNDENDKQNSNEVLQTRKLTQNKSIKYYLQQQDFPVYQQSGLKQRNPSGTTQEIRVNNLNQEKKVNDNSIDIKKLNITDIKLNITDDSLYFNQLKKKSAAQVKKKISNTQFQLQNNLDTLSQILQSQKLINRVEFLNDDLMSFGLPLQQEEQKQPLEIKTDLPTQMMQLLLRAQPKPSSTKERKYIEIPKYLLGCETTKAQTTVTEDQMVSPASNILNFREALIPNNILLEKRSGGDYFKFDFKNQKKNLQLQLQDHTKFFPSSKQGIESEKNTNFTRENTRDQIVDILIEDNGLMEEYSRDFCADIKFLTQQVVEDVDDLTKTEYFKDHYKVGSRVGQGAYAAVRVAVQIKTNRKVAIKIYEKSKIRDLQRRKGVRREVKLLQKLNHVNIAKILDTVESNNHINIILEYVGGGSLHSYLKKQTDRRLSEESCRPLMYQIIQATKYLHSKNICHRDIKLENILLDESCSPKLIDFGFSTCFPLERKVKMFCGTPSYMSPEIVSRIEYRGDKADIWALGVVLFALLQGFFPFKGSSDSDLYKKIQSGLIDPLTPLSENARSLLNSMLNIDSNQRLSASDILKHQWMKGERKLRPQIAEISLDQERIKHEDILTAGSFITPTNQPAGSFITPTNQPLRQFDFPLSSQPKVHSSYLKNQIMKKHPLAQSPMLSNPMNRMQYYTTTNAMLQQKTQINDSIQSANQYFFQARKNPIQQNAQQNTGRKISKTQPDNGRQKTLSYQLNSKCEQEQVDHKHPSYDSDIFHSLSRRGFSPQKIMLAFQDPQSEIGGLYSKLQTDKQRHLITIYPSYVPSDKSVGSLRSPSNDMAKKSKEMSRERSRERNRVHSQSKPFLDLNDEYRNRTFNVNE